MGKRTSRPNRDTLVVVTPSMVHPVATGNHMVQPKTTKQKHKTHSIKPKNGPAGQNFKLLRKQKPKQSPEKHTVVRHLNASSVIYSDWSTGVPRHNASYTVLPVKKESDVLPGVYWILLARDRIRSCVVTLPTRSNISSTQLTLMLKSLGLQATALHCKMTGTQRKVTIARLEACKLTSQGAMVVVTTDHLLPSIRCGEADVVLVGTAERTTVTDVAMAKFAHVYQVTVSTAARTEAMQQQSKLFHPKLTAPCLQQLQKRLTLARRIMDMTQHVDRTGGAAVQGDEWVRKLAKGAGLGDEEDEEARTKKRKRLVTPEEQRLQALVAKLYVELTRKLPGFESNASHPSIAGEQEADRQHRREKLQVLGLVIMNAVVGTAMTDERTSAQTRWMDFADGRVYGGQWDGPVRHGASKDTTSLALRDRLCAAKRNAKDASYLSKWAPNEGPVDTEKWGGMFGKVCGHNEVVLNELRAYYPQEVVNSKVCSKIFPAPGNQGFDGCLEHLRFACATQHRSMTLWDVEYFIFISTRGRVTWSKKSQLLSLSLASLLCLVPALRSWTAACGGRIPPSAVLRAIQLCTQLGCSDKLGNLPPKAFKRIMSFCFGGSARLWRQIAKVSTPLEAEMVYDSI